MLRLEGRASLCLLSYQRPLLSLLPVLPERLEALRSVLRVNGEAQQRRPWRGAVWKRGSGHQTSGAAAALCTCREGWRAV